MLFFCLPRSLGQTIDYIGLPEYLQFFFLPVLKTAEAVILISHREMLLALGRGVVESNNF